MSISAIVPVWNGRELLVRLLDSMDSQTLRAAELLVVDNGSTDGAPEMARSKLLVTWRTPKPLQIQAELHPRDCLLAEIRLHGNLKERAVVPLSNDPLIDVLMQSGTTDSTKVPTC